MVNVLKEAPGSSSKMENPSQDSSKPRPSAADLEDGRAMQRERVIVRCSCDSVWFTLAILAILIFAFIIYDNITNKSMHRTTRFI